MAADPEEAVHRYFRLRGEVLRVGDIDYFLSRFQRIFVIGAGKASVRMAKAVERVVGQQVSGGLVITCRGPANRLRNILVRGAGHPLPDEDGVKATEEMLELVEPLTDQDLVICVISGGGSALLTAPVDGVSVTDLQRANKILLSSGMAIHEINTVRKHLSRVKGGKLAEAIHPASVISLVMSDVIGDRVDVIASGPTAKDNTTAQDAVDVLNKKGLWEKVPRSVRDALIGGAKEQIGGPPEISEVFGRVHHQIVGSNRLSLLAAEKKAKKMGMSTMILSSSVAGQSSEIAQFYVALAREIREHNHPIRPPACLIAGGETTVNVVGKGKGGRCQEMALAVAMGIQDVPGVVFMAAGTDGVDGPTDAAGAMVDSETVDKASGLDLDPEDYLLENDSYNFFRELQCLINTGPTGTNVMDLHILLVG